MTTEAFQHRFLLLLVTAVTLVFVWMIRDFLSPLFFAAIFAALMRPLYLRTLSGLRGRRHAAAGLTLAAFVLLVILPLLGFGYVVVEQALQVTEKVTPWVQENLSTQQDINEQLRELPAYEHIRPYRREILQKITQLNNKLGSILVQGASIVTAQTLSFLIAFAIMLYAMFFFFLDGPEILRKMLYYLPLKDRDEERILACFLSMARASIKGLVVIGVIQGSLGGVALWAAGIPNAILWGTIMAVLSIVPNVGSAIVWVPACVYLFVSGQTGAGVGVFLWCALIVASADNILRPILVGKDAKVHEVLVLISTLGGVTLLGLKGFILGPAMALLFLTVWDIYGATFRDILPRPPRLEAEGTKVGARRSIAEAISHR